MVIINVLNILTLINPSWEKKVGACQMNEWTQQSYWQLKHKVICHDPGLPPLLPDQHDWY